MNCRTALAIAFCLILAGVVFLPGARGDKRERITTMEFNQPIETLRGVLPRVFQEEGKSMANEVHREVVAQPLNVTSNNAMPRT